MEYTNGTVVVIYSYVLCEYILETEDPTADRLMKDPKGGCIEGESEAMGARHTSIGLRNRFFFTTEGSDRLLLSHSLSNCRGGQQQSALVDRLMERSCSCSGPPPSQLKPIHSPPPPPFPPTSSASKGGMKTLESARHRKRGILISLSLPLPLLWAPNFKD